MLISFSGIDSSGKSTQILKVVEYFKSRGRKTKVIWSRGGYTPLFNIFKSILRKITDNALPRPGDSIHRNKTFKKKWVQVIWLNIALLDMILFYALYFRLLKMWGFIVIADRYLWDTFIDFELKFQKDSFEKNILWKTLVFLSTRPDPSIILIIPIEESMRRSKLKKEPFSENLIQRKKRLGLYKDLIEKSKWDYIIDGMKPIDEVWLNIRNKLK
jgi:thymidylate kinase